MYMGQVEAPPPPNALAIFKLITFSTEAFSDQRLSIFKFTKQLLLISMM